MTAEYPRDAVTSQAVPAILEHPAISAKLKAKQKITPADVDAALADYRNQLNANWLPILNQAKLQDDADAVKFDGITQQVADIRKTVEDFKQLLTLLAAKAGVSP